MNGQLKNSIEVSDEQIIRFKELSERYVNIGKDVGISIRAFTDNSLPYFHKASTEHQISALELLEFIVKTYEETIMAGENPLNTRTLLWRTLRKLNLSPTVDTFNHITDEDIVLIYDETFKNVFWNIQFFRVSSFTIEQLFFTVWPEMTKRDPKYFEQCLKLCQDVYSGKIRGDIFPDIPEHVVEEIDSPELIKTKMSIPFASTLTMNGNFGGLLVVQRMQIIS